MSEPTLKELQKDKKDIENKVSVMIKDFSIKYNARVDIDVSSSSFQGLDDNTPTHHEHIIKVNVEL